MYFGKRGNRLARSEHDDSNTMVVHQVEAHSLAGRVEHALRRAYRKPNMKYVLQHLR